MRILMTITLLAATVSFGCNNNDKSAPKESNTQTTSEEKKKDAGKPRQELMSGISLSETANLKVSRAFVSTVDGEVFKNEVTAGDGEKLILNLNMDGFKEEGGKCFVGVSEKITSSNGEVILDEQDLFSKYNETGLNPDDARFVRLSAVVTGNVSSNPYYMVTFRVWDKKAPGDVSGSYKIRTK